MALERALAVMLECTEDELALALSVELKLHAQMMPWRLTKAEDACAKALPWKRKHTAHGVLRLRLCDQAHAQRRKARPKDEVACVAVERFASRTICGRVAIKRKFTPTVVVY